MGHTETYDTLTDLKHTIYDEVNEKKYNHNLKKIEL